MGRGLLSVSRERRRAPRLRRSRNSDRSMSRARRSWNACRCDRIYSRVGALCVIEGRIFCGSHAHGRPA